MNPLVLMLVLVILIFVAKAQSSDADAGKSYQQHQLSFLNPQTGAELKIYDVSFCQNHAFALVSQKDNTNISLIKSSEQKGQLKKVQESTAKFTIFNKGNAQHAHLYCSDSQIIIQNIIQEKSRFIKGKKQTFFLSLTQGNDQNVQSKMEKQPLLSQDTNQRYFLIQLQKQSPVQKPQTTDSSTIQSSKQQLQNTQKEAIYHIWYNHDSQKIMVAHKVKEIISKQQKQQNDTQAKPKLQSLDQADKQKQLYDQFQWKIRQINSPLNIADIKAKTKAYTKVAMNNKYICMTFQFQQDSKNSILIQCYDLKNLQQIQDNVVMPKKSSLYDMEMSQTELFFYTYEQSLAENQSDSDKLIVFKLPDLVKIIFEQKTLQTPMSLQRSIQISSDQKYVATFNGMNLKIFQRSQNSTAGFYHDLRFIKQIRLQLPMENETTAKQYKNIKFGNVNPEAQSQNIFLFDAQFKNYLKVVLDDSKNKASVQTTSVQATNNQSNSNPVQTTSQQNATKATDIQTPPKTDSLQNNSSDINKPLQSSQTLKTDKSNQVTQLVNITQAQISTITPSNKQDTTNQNSINNQQTTTSSSPNQIASNPSPNTDSTTTQSQTQINDNDKQNDSNQIKNQNQNINKDPVITADSSTNNNSDTTNVVNPNPQQTSIELVKKQQTPQTNLDTNNLASSTSTQTSSSTSQGTTQGQGTNSQLQKQEPSESKTKTTQTTGINSGSQIPVTPNPTDNNNKVDNSITATPPKQTTVSEPQKTQNKVSQSQNSTQTTQNSSNLTVAQNQSSSTSISTSTQISTSTPSNTQQQNNKPQQTSKLQLQLQALSAQLQNKKKQLQQKQQTLLLKQKQIQLQNAQNQKLNLQIKEKIKSTEERYQKLVQKQKQLAVAQNSLQAQKQELRKSWQNLQTEAQKLKAHSKEIKKEEIELKQLQKQYNQKAQSVLNDIKTAVTELKTTSSAIPKTTQQQERKPQSSQTTSSNKNLHNLEIALNEDQQKTNKNQPSSRANPQDKKQKFSNYSNKQSQSDDQDIYFFTFAGICVVIVVAWFIIKKKKNNQSKNKDKLPSFSSESGGLKFQSQKTKLQSGQKNQSKGLGLNSTQIRLNTSEQLDDNMKISINDDQFQEATYVKDDPNNLI